MISIVQRPAGTTSSAALSLHYAPAPPPPCPDLLTARQFTIYSAALALGSLVALLRIVATSLDLTQAALPLLTLCFANVLGWSFAVGALLPRSIWWFTWVVVALLSCFWLILLGIAIYHALAFIASGQWLAFPF